MTCEERCDERAALAERRHRGWVGKVGEEAGERRGATGRGGGYGKDGAVAEREGRRGRHGRLVQGACARQGCVRRVMRRSAGFARPGVRGTNWAALRGGRCQEGRGRPGRGGGCWGPGCWG